MTSRSFGLWFAAVVAAAAAGFAFGGFGRPARDEKLVALLDAQAKDLEQIAREVRAAPSLITRKVAIAGAVRQANREPPAQEAGAAEGERVDAEPEPPPPADPAVIAAGVERSNAVIDKALSERTWRSSDSEQFNVQMVGVPAEKRRELRSRLARAINSGQLELEAF
jgi:hypothetical protein